MKKFIFGAAMIATIGNAYANTPTAAKSNLLKIAAANPSPSHNAASLAAFNAMFPGATTIRWSIKGELGYQVEFIYKGAKMKAIFSYTGTFIGL